MAPHRIALLFLVLVAAFPLFAQGLERTFELTGHTFVVRRSDGLEGPGPNRFLDNRRTVWQDDSGAIHLRTWQRLGMWFSAEIVHQTPLGYGTYIFETIGEVGEMDPSVILGMFTYDETDPTDRREIDIEFGRFGESNAPNAQFVVQPFDEEGRIYRFTVETEGSHLTHAFVWNENLVQFVVAHGHRADTIVAGGIGALAENMVAARWEFTQSPPDPGAAQVHMNLWLYESGEPTREHEVVFSSFHHIPVHTSIP